MECSMNEKPDSLDLPSPMSSPTLSDDTNINGHTCIAQEASTNQHHSEDDVTMCDKKMKIQNLNDDISNYKQELLHLDSNGKMMHKIMKQYKTTISELILSREKERAYADIEKEKILRQKSQIIEDLLSAESAYKDVKGKYERTKELIARCQNNEDKLKKCVGDKAEELSSGGMK